ncbi:MAG TPA: thioesterase family protein [Vicinamibacterales bacterium]|nr:thioesterase family protein [Vicinamibacterales bacterium]
MQFYELDSAGIVHFSWYFRYMEEAEHALWRQAGLSIARPDATVAFPRVAASFEYHRPLRFEEEFDVHIRVAAIGEKSIRYTCSIERDGVAIATGSATIVCATRAADGTLKSAPIPPEIADRFAVAGTGGS